MLNEAGEFLAFIFGNLFKGIWFLVRKAGLWVPLVFTALFFIVLAITSTPFSSMKAAFIIGLALTAVLGVTMSIAFKAKRLIDKKLPARERDGKIARVTVPEDKSEGESTVPAPSVETSDERPKIYRTRRAADVLIYEYSDRLDYYRVQGSERVKIYTEYKAEDGSVLARDPLGK